LLYFKGDFFYYWKPLMFYLKKVKQIKVFTPEFNFALIITILFFVWTHFLAPPFSV